MSFVRLPVCSDLKQDLPTAVRRICSFLGKELTDTQLADVVTHSTFKNMRLIPQANYEMVSDDLLNHHNGTFMRKGKERSALALIGERQLNTQQPFSIASYCAFRLWHCVTLA